MAEAWSSRGINGNAIAPGLFWTEMTAAVGKRVVLNLLLSCRVCDHSQGHHSNLCVHRELIGMRIPGADPTPG